MYSSSLQINLVGLTDEQNSCIQSIDPLEAFNHTYLLSSKISKDVVAGADMVIVVADTSEKISALKQILPLASSNCDIVVITLQSLFKDLEPVLVNLYDVWVAPLTNEELQFRISRWQVARKEKADAWQTAQYLEATIDSIPSLVWYKTRDGVHEKVNDSFCKTVRKTKEQVQGQRHAYIWDVEQDDPACIESENEVMASRKTCISEEVVQTGEGTRLLTTYKSPLYDIDGSVMGTVGVGIDITQEKAYEQDLIEKNNTLETIFRSLDCGVLTHSFDGKRILGVNQTALNILGYETEKELMDDGFVMIASSVLDEDKPHLLEQISQLTNVGDSISTQYRVIHPDGEILHVMGDLKLIEKDGERYIQRFLLDITDQKQREEQRARRQHNLIQALSQNYLVVCAFSLDTGEGEILRIAGNEDKDLVSVFSGEVTLEHTVNQYIEARVLDEDRQMMHETLSAKNIVAELEGKERFDRLYRTRKKDAVRYRQVTVVEVGGSEEGRFVVIGFRNVDQQIREELEQKALLEEALGSANRANEAKSSFLLNMSHDIRTPMNAIVGFTTLASSHVEEPRRVEEYLEKIKTSSDHLLNLINDILDMSRIERGKVSLDEQQCNLVEIFTDLQTMLQAQADSEGLAFEVDANDVSHPQVICDRLKVNQVLLNLLSNSLKFTPSGGTVSAKLSEISGAPAGFGKYRFVIEDTGIGMAPGFLKYIFDPFERERTQTISGIQGSGLGMAIVKSLVDMMNGSIKVESEEGVGTRFTVILTFKLAQATSKLTETEKHSHIVFTPERASRYRVLLVDDNMLNREIAEELLSDAGFKVETAVNGEIALQKVAESFPGYFDLVLMDIQMPVMNGYESATAIRKLEDPNLSRIPIFAVTADAFDEDRQRALDCGMNGHLPKPIEISKLFEILDAVLD